MVLGADEDKSDDAGIDFNTKAVGLVQQVKFRVADSPLFLGVKYLYAATDTTFDRGPEDTVAYLTVGSAW